MRSMHFMPVIAFDSFQMSKTKLKVAPYWIKADILKQFPGYFSYLSFGTVDVYGHDPLSTKRIFDKNRCLRISLLSKTRQMIIFNSRNSHQKTSIPQNVTWYNSPHNFRGGTSCNTPI